MLPANLLWWIGAGIVMAVLVQVLWLTWDLIRRSNLRHARQQRALELLGLRLAAMRREDGDKKAAALASVGSQQDLQLLTRGRRVMVHKFMTRLYPKGPFRAVSVFVKYLPFQMTAHKLEAALAGIGHPPLHAVVPRDFARVLGSFIIEEKKRQPR